jgi:adenosylmethionine-8-amino-7-oxononanoate aminotransferase
LGHAFYASDGASAVEIALKMSHHFWQLNNKPNKKKFVCLENGYHGETLGALAVTDVAIFRDAYGSLLQDVFTVASPDARKAKFGESAEDVAKQAANALEKLFEQEHQNIAAIIVEPLVHQNICGKSECSAIALIFTSSRMRLLLAADAAVNFLPVSTLVSGQTF